MIETFEGQYLHCMHLFLMCRIQNHTSQFVGTESGTQPHDSGFLDSETDFLVPIVGLVDCDCYE